MEESYYTLEKKTNSSAHLFTDERKGIKLTSYEIPHGYDKSSFTYQKMEEPDYSSLKVSEKFTPAVYALKDGVWEGRSASMFTLVLKCVFLRKNWK